MDWDLSDAVMMAAMGLVSLGCLIATVFAQFFQ